MIIETERLYMRELMIQDMPALCKILQDEKVMYAYEHAFDDEEVKAWLDNQIQRYQLNGYGLWAVILKENNELIGQCGLTQQMVRNHEVVEVGYLFQRAYWHQGYAIEAAIACKEYAMHTLHLKEVYSIIRDTNRASKKVAERNGMNVVDHIVKHYHGMDMPHDVYCYKHHT